ncbi:MAG: hypothetical protein ACKVLO_13850 [Pseudomonadales bacterium]
MTNEKRRSKVQNLYLTEKTHATLKALSAHQEITIQTAAANWLEETQPILQDMVNALDDIKNGKNAVKTYNNFFAKSLHKVADSLEVDEK